jgi:hypothetical protein
LSPKRLDLYCGGGSGILLLRQGYALPPEHQSDDLDPQSFTKVKPIFFTQGFGGLRLSPSNKFTFWGDGGQIFFLTKLSTWSATNKNDPNHSVLLNQEWLQYQNLKLGGKWIRVGIAINL